MHAFLTGDAEYKSLGHILQRSAFEHEENNRGKIKIRPGYFSFVMTPHHGS
jgi:hypothetical protein